MNSLSQYIGKIIEHRNAELQQRLAPVVQLIDEQIRQKKAKEQYAEQMKQRSGDLYNMAETMYGEGAGNEFSQQTTNLQTMEGVDYAWKNFAWQKEGQKEIGDYANILKSVGVPDDKVAEAQQQMSAQTTPEGRKAIYLSYGKFSTESAEELDKKAKLQGPDFYATYKASMTTTNDPYLAFGSATQRQNEIQAAQSRARSYSGSGGGGGGTTPGKAKVTDEYRSQVKKVYNGKKYVYITGNNGEIVKAPAKLDSEGRLYLEGEQGSYEVNPYDCLSLNDNVNRYIIKKSDVDRWQGKPGKQAKQESGQGWVWE